MSFSFQKINAQDTYDIRHQVLWPDLPIEACMLSEDDTALHFGGLVGGQLIAVASLFPDGVDKIRLRKFAILPAYQSQGIGSKMLQGMQDHLRHTSYKTLWCDAREEALGFYQKNGFSAWGERFFKKHLPYIKAKIDLNQT
ncbi:GNAT family N-acetyltransferase [Terasakiella sp. A23]|uniref:GNAT family N-acetyltransferase n=1 Tax=Terasakiella sp. FCG-A23 TaxID=3080561 RepID=UPI00295416F0|nr:GNAT family N-acetyltransferase [Terasakiella sp. A23]MDV7340723.1 GNAT family N-acetyltransferase [Terasakiella sp. A23]